tara:strand:+ start:344 stop:838 length:495 start_codon:yes stop_codon:yes gene_type:complete
MKFIKSKIFLKILIILIVLILDRISKNYVINLFNENQFNEIYLLDFINIHFVWNEGIAFGLLSFNDDSIYKMITLIIIFITIIIFIFSLKTQNYIGFFFAIICGGALGNLYDRIKFSAVPDFIDLHIGNYHWFIFNVADIFITLGIFCLIFDELFMNKKNNEKN